MFDHLREDIRSIIERDPAARNAWEVFTCYPGFQAIMMHRWAHWCWSKRLRWPGRDAIFIGYLATMMLPGLVMMIPNYQIMIALGLVVNVALLAVFFAENPLYGLSGFALVGLLWGGYLLLARVTPHELASEEQAEWPSES